MKYKMSKNQWLIITLLFVALFFFSSASLQFVNQKHHVKQSNQSSELVAQLAIPYLIENEHLALQAELNRMLRIEGMLSVSVVSDTFDAIAKAQHIASINADTQYFSRPIRVSLNSNADQIIGYAQVAMQPPEQSNRYLSALIVALVMTLVIQLIFKLQGSQSERDNRRIITELKTQLALWRPDVLNTKSLTGGRLNNHDQMYHNKCSVLIHYYQLYEWQQRIQPHIANQVLQTFEHYFHKQLSIYGGIAIGNLVNGSQMVLFEGSQASQRCFAFSSGLVYVLAPSINDLPLPLSAMLLPDQARLSSESLLNLPEYQQLFSEQCKQLEQLQNQSESNHLVVDVNHQHHFQRHASFSDTPINDLVLITPSDSTLKLWKRQLGSTAKSVPSNCKAGI